MTKAPTDNQSSALSDVELEALQKSGELAQLMRQIIGEGPHTYNDWLEATIHIHAIQNMIMSQAAARAYPGRFRLLGQTMEPKTGANPDTEQQ